jgi:hypothetical protein
MSPLSSHSPTGHSPQKQESITGRSCTGDTQHTAGANAILRIQTLAVRLGKILDSAALWLFSGRLVSRDSRLSYTEIYLSTRAIVGSECGFSRGALRGAKHISLGNVSSIPPEALGYK